VTSWSSFAVGTVTASEGALLIRPKIPTSPARRGVISVHGAGSGATHCIQPYGKQSTQTNAVTDAGFTIFSGDVGGDTWGNATGMARMTAAYNYLQGVAGVTPGKVALISGSMGGLISLNWAAANPTLVSAIVSCIPVINPNDIVTNNRALLGSNYAPLVNAAYGGAYSESVYGAACNPRTIATTTARLQGIPMLFFYGLTDTLCVPAEIVAFAASPGMNVTLVPLATGHEEATYSAVDFPRVAEFLKTNAA